MILKIRGKFWVPFWHILRMLVLDIDAPAAINRVLSGDIKLGGKNLTALSESSPCVLPPEKSRHPENCGDLPVQVL